MRRDEEDDIGVLDTSVADKSATANDQKPPGAGQTLLEKIRAEELRKAENQNASISQDKD